MTTTLDPTRLAAVRAGMEGPAAKIRHASKHLRSLQYQAHKWFKTEPYDVVLDFDPVKPWITGRLKVLQEPPEVLGLLAGDFVHDLRSSLDHTVYQLARLTTDQPEGTQFPIFLDSDDYRRRRGANPSFRETYLAGVPDEYRAFIDDCQPFDAPDPLADNLAVLKAFSNVDKHRLINTAYFTPGFDLEVVPMGFSVESFEIRYPPPGRVDDGAELFRFRPRGAVEFDVDVDMVGIDHRVSLEVVWGPGGHDLNRLMDLWLYVFRIVGTLYTFISDPTGLPHAVEPHRATGLRAPDPWVEGIRSRRRR